VNNRDSYDERRDVRFQLTDKNKRSPWAKPQSRIMAASNSRQTYSQEPKNRAVFRGTGSHFSNNDRRGPYGYQAGALASFT
jgi:hypothetical protein